MPRVSMAHESYAMLYRLASRENAVTKVEVEIEQQVHPRAGHRLQHHRRGQGVGEAGRVRRRRRAPRLVGPRHRLDRQRDRQLRRAGGRPHGRARWRSRVTAEADDPVLPVHRRGAGAGGSRKYVERHKDEMPKHSAAHRPRHRDRQGDRVRRPGPRELQEDPRRGTRRAQEARGLDRADDGRPPRRHRPLVVPPGRRARASPATRTATSTTCRTTPRPTRSTRRRSRT